MRNEISKISNVTDKDFVNNLGIKQLPPTDDDISNILMSIRPKKCISNSAVKEINESADDILGKDASKDIKPSNFVFVSLQSLVPALLALGYDIRPVLVNDTMGVLEILRDQVAIRTSVTPPKLSGTRVEIDGQYGIIWDREWLRTAGVNPDVKWQNNLNSPENTISR